MLFKADGFDVTNIENTNRSYFLKHLLMLGVLFFFFNFERFMKIYAIYRTQVKTALKCFIPSLIFNNFFFQEIQRKTTIASSRAK